jgi:sulfoxide reductase heme-binding subunit YedZ
MPLRPIIFLLALVPLPIVIWQSGQGPDPGKTVVLLTGLWAIRFLIITLSLSPIRRWFGFSAVLHYRRMLGLYVWFYASLHLMAVLTYILGWSGLVFLEEFTERPYMALGILAWLSLIPLGLTSNRWMMKKLGRRWKRLHRLVYVAAILACGHFIWLIRSDYGEAMTYSLLIFVLLIARLPFLGRDRAAATG